MVTHYGVTEAVMDCAVAAVSPASTTRQLTDADIDEFGSQLRKFYGAMFFVSIILWALNTDLPPADHSDTICGVLEGVVEELDDLVLQFEETRLLI